MSSSGQEVTAPFRRLIYSGLSVIEDVVYVGLGVVLAATAVCLLFLTARTFIHALAARALASQVITLLDQILLILLIVELLYTVQVSFRQHTLVAEPFLVVALIATVRKILILTAQISQVPAADPAFYHFLAELALLALMVLVLVGSVILLQRRHAGTGHPTLPEHPS